MIGHGNVTLRSTGVALVLLLLPCMVQAATPWATAKSVARQISAVPIVVLRMITKPNLLDEGLSALASSQGTLVVDGLPPGATVEVDGIVVHPTPSINTPLWVVPGTHTLRILEPLEEELVRADVTVGPRQLVHWHFPRIKRGEDGLSRNGWGYLLIGGGALLAGGGIVLGLLSHEHVKDVGHLSRGPDKGAWEDGVAKGQALQLGANLSFGVATLLIGGGIYLLLTEGDPTPSKGESGVQITPTGAIFTW